MASGDVQVQSAVYSLEQGMWAKVIKISMFSLLIVVLSLVYLFIQFAGLSTPTAMDQAHIARNLSEGKGFTTDYITPLALNTLRDAGKLGPEDAPADVSRLPDFYQSPLNPWLNSFALWIVKPGEKASSTDLIYRGDRVLATVSLVFFLLSVGIWYFVGSQLFDSKLALYGCAMALLTDLFWQFSLSALPQMLLLFLFSLSVLTTLYAMQAKEREQLGLMVAYLIGTGLLFGLMALAHGLTLWMFLGWLIFAGVYFQPRGLAAAAALGAFLIVVSPWMVRNYQVCGQPLGLAFQAAFYEDSPEIGYLRSSDGETSGQKVKLLGKLRRNVLNQGNNLFGLLGTNIVAMVFFIALMHAFRNERTSLFRWCIVLMWIGALIGMSLYYTEGQVAANQLHVLFIPLFVFYGLAFLFIMWSRLEFGLGLFRIVFIGLLIAGCAIPMVLTRVAVPPARFQWPPYVPPIIGYLNEWFQENEVIASDMPWAVAWYAHRKSLLIPQRLENFNRIHDYSELKQPLSGLFLTPLTGNAKLFSGIYKGPYADWAPLITRPPQTKGFPFPIFTPLPIDNECILYTDSPRWNKPRE